MDGENYNLIDINIPNSYVAEANILMQSGEQLIDVSLKNPDGGQVELAESNNVYFSREDKYSIIKIVSPAKGNWLLGVKGVRDDEVMISLLYNYDLSLSARIQESGPFTEGSEVTVIGEFLDIWGKPLAAGISAATIGQAVVKDGSGSVLEEIDMKNDGSRLSAKYTLPTGHSSVVFVVNSSGDGFYRESEPVSIAVGRAPQATATPLAATATPISSGPSATPAASPPQNRIGLIFFIHFPFVNNGGGFDASERIDGLTGISSVECEDPNAVFEIDRSIVSVAAKSPFNLLNVEATLKYTDGSGASAQAFRVFGFPGVYLVLLVLLAAAALVLNALKDQIGHLIRKLKRVRLYGRLLYSIQDDGVYLPDAPPVDFSSMKLRGNIALEKLIPSCPQLKGIFVRQLVPGPDSPVFLLTFSNKSKCSMSQESLTFRQELTITDTTGNKRISLTYQDAY
jgi:hypothetical protein